MKRARGLTFIEVVIAVAILAGVAAMITSATTFSLNSASRNRHRLNAMEVAHRVVLQYIDDPDQLEGQVKRIQLGDSMYEYTLREDTLTQDTDNLSGRDRRAARSSTSLSAEERISARMHQITVTVFPPRDDERLATGEPLAELVRVYNPLGGNEENVLSYIVNLLKKDLDSQARTGEGGAQRGGGTRK